MLAKPLKKHWMSIRKRLRLAVSERFFVRRVDDKLFLLDIRNRVDRHIDFSGCYEAEQVSYFTKLIRQQGCTVFLDIGAHWGYYTILLALNPELRGIEFHAFEPDKINRYQLYANLFINKLEQEVNVHEYGVSDFNGTANFHSYDETNRGKSRISPQGQGAIKVRRLDDEIVANNEVVAIKIDVEGHEIGVVDGMQQLLRNNQCLLQIESFENKFPVLLKQLESLGYSQIKVINQDHYFTNIKSLA